MLLEKVVGISVAIMLLPRMHRLALHACGQDMSLTKTSTYSCFPLERQLFTILSNRTKAIDEDEIMGTLLLSVGEIIHFSTLPFLNLTGIWDIFR